MMESLAQKQERAYERLYHWLQKCLHLFQAKANTPGDGYLNDQNNTLDEALHHAFVRRSLHTLRHVPAFYSHTLELVASSRRSEETRRFLLALTSGYDGLPPIEMKSHDAVAYTSDMLAFSFKAFSVEADVAKGLLMYQPEEEGEPKEEEKEELPEEDEGYMVDKPMTAADMLSTSMGGLARPLKSRILQVISTLARRPEEQDTEYDNDDDFEDEGVRIRLKHLYEICGLLLFYAAAMEKGLRKLIPPQQEGQDAVRSEPNRLVACLQECLGEAVQSYEASIRVYGAMMNQLASTTGDSEATLAHSMLVLIANVRLSSPGFSSEVECPRMVSRDLLSLEWATETLIEAALGACKAIDDAVSLKQSVEVARNAGMSELKAEMLFESIDRKEAVLVNDLVAKESGRVLDLCGLGPLVAAWIQWDYEKEGELMAVYPGLAQEEVEASMKEFYASLFSPPLPSLDTSIKDPVLRKTARSKIASSVCETYENLYGCIMSSGKGGYEDLSFLGHTPDQVKTLLSV
jgi:hypothetical protein